MQIHIGRNNQQLGTFSVPQVLDRLARGEILPTDLAWHEGLADWQPVSSLAILNTAHAAVPPPLASPPPISQPVFQPQRPAHAAPQTAETCGLAGWSLGLGIGSFFFYLLTAIPAVICGHMALSRIKKSGGALGGRGMAIAGLVMGYVMIASLPMLAAIAVPTFQVVQQQALQSKSAAQVRMILMACKLHAADHGGSYPPDLETLQKEGLIEDPAILHCPLLKDDTQIGYRYYGAGLKESDAPDKVVIISIAASQGKRIVGRNDGQVEIMAVPEVPQPR